MADEAAVKGTEPEVDISKLQPAITAAVTAGLAERDARNAATVREMQEQQAAEAAARAARNPGDDAVADVLRPHLAPAINMLNMKSDDAKDAAIFYNTTPEAGKHSAQIEAKFNELAKAGRPLNRASIWQWLRGSDQFLDQRIKERDEELKRARDAQTLAGNRGGMPTQRPEIDVNATDDELSSAVKDLAF